MERGVIKRLLYKILDFLWDNNPNRGSNFDGGGVADGSTFVTFFVVELLSQFTFIASRAGPTNKLLCACTQHHPGCRW